MNNTFNELIKKIQLQSIIVLILTLGAGCYLLHIDDSFIKPAGILGSLSIVIGLIYTLFSFFSNSMNESYKHLIETYKKTIDDLRSSHQYIQGSYQTREDKLCSQLNSKEIGSYQTINESSTRNN